MVSVSVHSCLSDFIQAKAKFVHCIVKFALCKLVSQQTVSISIGYYCHLEEHHVWYATDLFPINQLQLICGRHRQSQFTESQIGENLPTQPSGKHGRNTECVTRGLGT